MISNMLNVSASWEETCLKVILKRR